MDKGQKLCHHKGCVSRATWQVQSHGWGMVTHWGYYCDKHFAHRISAYKLNPKEDIVRLEEG